MNIDASLRNRVVLIGDASVGKTCILAQLIDHKFSQNESSTIGANSQIYIENINKDKKDCKVEIQIWDTAGQERFQSLGPIYYRNASAALAVFDMTNKTTFDHLEKWIESFREVAGQNALVYIVANKSDLTDQIQVPFIEAKSFAEQQGFAIYETSAKTGKNIQKMFYDLASKILDEKISSSSPIIENKPDNKNCCV